MSRYLYVKTQERREGREEHCREAELWPPKMSASYSPEPVNVTLHGRRELSLLIR